MNKLSDILQVRVTPELKQAVWDEANRLKLRPADVMRFAMATLCAGERAQSGSDDSKVTVGNDEL